MLPGLVTKQKPVEFPQVLAIVHIIVSHSWLVELLEFFCGDIGQSCYQGVR